MPDKFTAVWVSHSSLGDFLRCKRAYYLHNIYKDPSTKRKINIVSPALSLGIAVHSVLESLRTFKQEERFTHNLLTDLEKEWEKVHGEKGGFSSKEEEKEMKERAIKMIEKAQEYKGPLMKKTILLPQEREKKLPHFYLSEKENIILCGKLDWIEYKEEDDSLRIIDFKTGKKEERDDSLQLPIYTLLLHHLQKRKVSGAAYWYLENNLLQEKELPSLKEAKEKVSLIAKQVKKAREEKDFLCPYGEEGCFACKPYEMIVQKKAHFVGVGEYNQDLYMIKKEGKEEKENIIPF
jgi:ATP-dependent helicase/DNAse subunit B